MLCIIYCFLFLQLNTKGTVWFLKFWKSYSRGLRGLTLPAESYYYFISFSRTLILFSAFLSECKAGGGADGGAGAGANGDTVATFEPSTETLLLSFAIRDSWWLFSAPSGRVAERLARASFIADGLTGGAGGAALGGPGAVTPPLTESDLKNSSRLLCNWN